MNKKKKEPKDYGLFCFRITLEQRMELNTLIDETKARLNQDRVAGEYVITKNRIIFEAIKNGLPLIKKP